LSNGDRILVFAINIPCGRMTAAARDVIFWGFSQEMHVEFFCWYSVGKNAKIEGAASTVSY
jgi:hypothetical protein